MVDMNPRHASDAATGPECVSRSRRVAGWQVWVASPLPPGHAARAEAERRARRGERSHRWTKRAGSRGGKSTQEARWQMVGSV